MSESTSSNESEIKIDFDFLREQTPSLLDVRTTPTFFDVLSDDELTRVSQFAHSRNNYLSLLFDQISPFRRISPNLFKTIHLNDTRRLNFNVKHGIIECGRGRDWPQIQRIFRICGPQITRVELHSASFFQPIGPYARAVRRACPNVTTLGLRGEDSEAFSNRTVEDFLVEFHGMVTTLDLRLRRKYNLEPAGIVGEFALDHVAGFEGHRIKSFTYRGDSAGHLVPFLYAIRSSLEEVHIEFLRYGNWNDTVNALRDHCRKLKVIMLDNPLRGNMVSEQLFTMLFLSFGPQLQLAKLHSLSVEYCKLIAIRCTNLRAEFVEKRSQFERLSVLGERIESLTLRVKNNDTGWSPLRKAIEACSNLTSLKVYRKQDNLSFRSNTIRDECIRSIFSTHMARLERLTLSGIVGWQFSLDRIAKHTSQLRELRILRASYLYYSFSAFIDLVNGNPFLQTVEIEDEQVRSKKSETTDYIKNLFRFLLLCQRLQSFELRAHMSVTPDAGVLNALCLKLTNARVCFAFIFQPEKRRQNGRKRKRSG